MKPSTSTTPRRAKRCGTMRASTRSWASRQPDDPGGRKGKNRAGRDFKRFQDARTAEIFNELAERSARSKVRSRSKPSTRSSIASTSTFPNSRRVSSRRKAWNTSRRLSEGRLSLMFQQSLFGCFRIRAPASPAPRDEQHHRDDLCPVCASGLGLAQPGA